MIEWIYFKILFSIVFGLIGIACIGGTIELFKDEMYWEMFMPLACIVLCISGILVMLTLK